eukprot:13719183-Ditylum_brightwellii.AAC.1
MGWQQDTLPKADIILNLVGGGYTEQRVMATERLVRESLSFAPTDVAFITVSPTEEDIKALCEQICEVVGKIEKSKE